MQPRSYGKPFQVRKKYCVLNGQYRLELLNCLNVNLPLNSNELFEGKTFDLAWQRELNSVRKSKALFRLGPVL